MKIDNDMTLSLATASSRTAKVWKNAEWLWSELAERCSKPKRTGETYAEYVMMSRAEQSARKDVGGFVGGYLTGGERRNGHVARRSCATLDIDFGRGDVWERFTEQYGCAALIYSTHKHSKASPRYRLVVPFSRPVEPWEYEPVCRRIAFNIGIDMFDHTTYELPRLFYWPSCAEDGEFFFRLQDGAPLDVDDTLASYDDPRDASAWPYGRGEAITMRREMKRAGDPTAKRGIVGAFCRTYTIGEAIAKFLDDQYEPTAQPDRYTYRLGSVAGGLVCYEDKFAYSHHDTDPASRQLCNAFDLVRIHYFHDEDEEAKTDDVTKLPSYRRMCDLAGSDSLVARTMQEERAQRAQRAQNDFEGVEAPDEGEERKEKPAKGGDWMAGLEYGKNGNITVNTNNILLILRNDPKLAGRFWHDDFSGFDMADDTLPWPRQAGMWCDKDDAALRVYMDTTYGITGKEKISDALDTVFMSRRRHPVREYLKGVEKLWDGTPRLDRLIISYIGAEDNELNRQMTRKAFTAAVARVMRPGCKYDYCLIMTGGEGIGKSTLLKIMGGDWFSDSVTTTEGKEGMESLRMAWIIELAELASIKRSDVEQVKSFISKREDRYRQAYGKRITEFKRQCVFFGTTNEASFLKGDTGNRRFWVIPVSHDLRGVEGDVFGALQADRDQLWAEAVHYYREEERLYLEPELEEQARERQQEFNVDGDDPMPGMLDEYLSQRLPVDWYSWDTARRRAFFQQRDPLSNESMERTKMFAGEFLFEMYGYTDRDKEYKYRMKQVNRIMREKPDWETQSVRIPGYGVQKGYAKKLQGKLQKSYSENL